MAKNKNEKNETDLSLVNKPLARMTAEQYWKWRCSTLELAKAEMDLKLAQSEYKSMSLELQNSQLKIQLFAKTRLASCAAGLNNYKDEYEKDRQELSKEIGVDLKNKTINESFEVHEIPKEEKGVNDGTN